MDELKLQFKPAMMKGGRMKIKRIGGKHYVAGFTQGYVMVHQSRVIHRTALDAILYSDMVIERYRRMAVVAFQKYLESASTTAPLSEEVENVAAN